MQQRIINILFGVIIIILTGVVVYLTFGNKSTPATDITPAPAKITPIVKTPAPVTSTDGTSDSASTPPTLQDLNNIFDLSKKEAGTKIYYSDTLGVGFTYMPNQVGTTFTVKVTEIGNKIYIHGDKEKPEAGQSIEVFSKDPKMTFEEAIKAKFLSNINPKNCFVKIYDETNGKQLPEYVSAGISFPQNNDSIIDGATTYGCPLNYSETNGVQYFLMNKNIQNKFLFVKIGQDAITSDGTPVTSEGGFTWSHSIKILR